MRRLATRMVFVVLVAALLAGWSGYRATLSPLGVHPREVGFGAAEASIFVDTPTSTLIDTSQNAFAPPAFALNYALFLQADGVRAEIEQAAGIPIGTLQASGPFTDLLPRPNIVRKLAVAAPQESSSRYRLVLDVADGRPVLTFHAQAPGAATARRIVDAAETVLRRSVTQRQIAFPAPRSDSIVLRTLGPTTSGTVAPQGRLELMAVVFGLALLIGGALAYLRERKRRWRALERRPLHQSEFLRPEPDCWPHTSRPLPWALAGFLVMIFLIPFDAIQLPIHMPLNGKLDRPVLLALAGIWILALLSPVKEARPRVRLTRVHVAALIFFSACCVGAVLNAPALVNLQEYTLVLKKLALLISFLVFFVIVASSLRPQEIPAYIKFMLGLALVAAVGAILEYRFRWNPFYSWSAQLLPGDVEVPGDLYSRDSIGRLTVYGPTGHPLELATLLAAMVPFAMLGMAEAEDRRKRWLYAAAMALLLAGAVSTVRKTSVIAPVPGIALLIAYRPRVLSKRLLPMVLVMGVLVHFAAPGTLGSLVTQLSPSHFGNVRSSQDRTSDYDGVRPDVISHLLFGRGYQSYDPHKYRILDNEYLFLIIGVGLGGLLAYLLIIAAALSAAHRTARSRDPVRARFTLGAAAAVAVVGMATALFDVLSFPHVPYLFFFMAAIIVVLREPSSHALPPPEDRWTYERGEVPEFPVVVREPVGI